MWKIFDIYFDSWYKDFVQNNKHPSSHFKFPRHSVILYLPVYLNQNFEDKMLNMAQAEKAGKVKRGKLLSQIAWCFTQKL